MTGDRRGNGKGRPTLFDGLSSENRQALAGLADTLRARVRRRIDSQVARPVEPWRKRGITTVPSPASVKDKPVVASSRQSAVASAQPVAMAPIAQEKAEDWTLPVEASVREVPPKWASAVDRMAMEAILDAATGSIDREGEGEPLFATIGLDFGTSCTKIIVQFPEEPESPAIAIPVPAHCRSGANPYLWQTVVWVRRDGTFVPWPEPQALPVHTLKQGVVGDRSHAVVAPGHGNIPITRLDAAAAYLAFAIRYAKGWLLKNRAIRFKGRRPVWFINVGLPTANYDDDRLVARYRAVAATGLLLAGSSEVVSVETTRAVASSREVSEAAASVAKAEALGIAVFPEVAAEVAGFMKSTAGASGLYLVVDVGAMTLDVCAFRFQYRQVAGDLYPLLETDVRPLGVEAYHWFMEEGRSPEGFRKQCDLALKQVIWNTKRERDPNAACWRPGNELPIFLVGGGAANELHRAVVDGLHEWSKKFVRNDGIQLTSLTVPATLEWPEPGGAFNRMPVAWGLSYAPTEIGEIMPPSQIESISAANVRNYLAAFVSKDDV